MSQYKCNNPSRSGDSWLQGFKGYRFWVFKETWIKVRVSSWTIIRIWIPKTCLLKDLLKGAILTTYPTYIITEGNSLNFEIKLPSILLVPLVWDMEDMYGTFKGHCRFLTPSNYMILSGNSILGMICNNCKICNNLHLSWHGKVYSNIWRDHPWMIITNYVMPMRLTLKNGVSTGRKITFPSPKVDWWHRHLSH